MTLQRRYLFPQVRKDLARKMVFVAGPRQVGKTTLALSLPGASAGYLSWDIAEHRERILKRELPDSRLWIFDEIHKYRSWRNLLKGLYDGRRPSRGCLLNASGATPMLIGVFVTSKPVSPKRRRGRYRQPAKKTT